MKIKGLDNGYLYTKDNEERFFKSAITKDIIAMNGTNNIVINNIGYTVGSGLPIIKTNKINSEMNMVGTLYNLALTGSDEYFLVVGLPIKQFAAQKYEFREEILKYNKANVYYKDRYFKFEIKDVFVFPQGAAALISQPNLTDRDFIILDIGGLTVDIAHIELNNGSPIMHKSDTIFDGMQKLYTDIIFAVNNKFDMTLTPDEAEKILKNNKITVDGINQDISFLEPIKQVFLERTIRELKLNYSSRTTPIYVAGGGGISLYNTISNEFKNTFLIENSQFANAKGYHKVGLIKYKKYITIPNGTNKNIIWEMPKNA